MKSGVRKFAVAVAASTMAAACEQSPTMVPADDFAHAAAVVPADNAAAFQVTVCKEGPAGPSTFSVTGNPPAPTATGTISFPHTNTFTLVNDECKTVATTTGSRQSVTVVETAPATGWQFSQVEVWEFFTGTGATTLDRVEFDESVTLNPFGNDRGLVVIYKNVPITGGCTFTQGYWKNHSEKGPAPYNDTWASLANGADTPFFLSGQTWYEVFNTAVAGNQYYSLAHQYMAASLNLAAGTSAPSNVLSALSDAESLFNTYAPSAIAGLKGNSSLRAQFVALAGVLASYNEGDIGPGHCPD